MWSLHQRLSHSWQDTASSPSIPAGHHIFHGDSASGGISSRPCHLLVMLICPSLDLRVSSPALRGREGSPAGRGLVLGMGVFFFCVVHEDHHSVPQKGPHF